MQQQHVKGVDAQTGAAVKQPMLPSWFSFDPDFGMLDGGIKTLKMMVGGGCQWNSQKEVLIFAPTATFERERRKNFRR